MQFYIEDPQEKEDNCIFTGNEAVEGKEAKDIRIPARLAKARPDGLFAIKHINDKKGLIWMEYIPFGQLNQKYPYGEYRRCGDYYYMLIETKNGF